jgi:hypothetical protein
MGAKTKVQRHLVPIGTNPATTGGPESTLRVCSLRICSSSGFRRKMKSFFLIGSVIGAVSSRFDPLLDFVVAGLAAHFKKYGQVAQISFNECRSTTSCVLLHPHGPPS